MTGSPDCTRSRARGIIVRMSNLGRIALVAFCAAALAGSGAEADCPDGRFQLFTDPSSPQVPLVASAWDTTIALPYTAAHAGYDLAAGTAHFDVLSSPSAIVHLLLSDAFTIEGPPAGTPCAVRAELRFAGSLLAYGGHGSAAYAAAALRVGSAPEASVFVPTNGPGVVTPFDPVLGVDLEVPAGVPFRLDCEFDGGPNVGGDAQADAHATLVVTTTEPSGRPVSCHGFGGATAVRARTWGAIKALYH